MMARLGSLRIPNSGVSAWSPAIKCWPIFQADVGPPDVIHFDPPGRPGADKTSLAATTHAG